MSENRQAILPPHLAQLDGRAWALWRWVGLRSAGFPIERLLPLSNPACAVSADSVLAAECQEHALREKLVGALTQKLEEAWPGSQERTVQRIIARLEQGKQPDTRMAQGIEVEL